MVLFTNKLITKMNKTVKKNLSKYYKNNLHHPWKYLGLLYTHIQMNAEHIQHNNDEQTQFFRKIYLSLYWKGCVWESWRLNKDCNILTPPQLFWLSQPFFPVLLSCSTGGLGAQPLPGHGSHSSIFSPTDLNFLSPGLYNNLASTYFLRASRFALNSTPRLSRSPPDIFDRMHLLFTQMLFFLWQLGRGQYVTGPQSQAVETLNLSDSVSILLTDFKSISTCLGLCCIPEPIMFRYTSTYNFVVFSEVLRIGITQTVRTPAC